MDSVLEGSRGGSTYEPQRDFARLNAQHHRVYRAIRGGEWWTLAEIETITGDPQASISARIRDFRKKEYGHHHVLRRYVANGLWEYRLIWRPSVPTPEEQLADLPD